MDIECIVPVAVWYRNREGAFVYSSCDEKIAELEMKCLLRKQWLTISS